MSEVSRIPVNKTYRENQNLFDELNDVIASYNNKISLAEVIGVLELLKIQVLDDNESQ